MSMVAFGLEACTVVFNHWSVVLGHGSTKLDGHALLFCCRYGYRYKSADNNVYDQYFEQPGSRASVGVYI